MSKQEKSNMEKIPTAEKFLEDFELGTTGKVDIEDAKQAIIEFARLHVETALKAAHKNMQLPQEDLEFTLNSYPLENIK